jgi:hypothetical protein
MKLKTSAFESDTLYLTYFDLIKLLFGKVLTCGPLEVKLKGNKRKGNRRLWETVIQE